MALRWGIFSETRALLDAGDALNFHTLNQNPRSPSRFVPAASVIVRRIFFARNRRRVKALAAFPLAWRA